ncbi:hypothetical protein [Janthinobacterium sp. SUN206]|uniref:hypothetical protein n=1 Tax=Janthinobacterium sp. SUN206 TaxID=3014787 RepID=UPI002713560E|nr:hypothetical protein [Janthinobacterium sp. SUN206]MDO8065590.1 hypothetical protein [Janthinobacterium sp. SUN206]
MKYPYLTVALLVIFGVIDIIILGNNFDLTKSDWSGWVQAIGSIAALGVAIFVMSRQNRHAAKLLIDADKRALLRRAQAVSAILDRAHEQIPELCELIANSVAIRNEGLVRSTMATAKYLLKEVQAAIRAIPAHELGSYEMVTGLNKTMEVLTSFDKIIDTWLQGTNLPHPTDIGTSLVIATNSSKEAKDIFSLGIERLRRE